MIFYILMESFTNLEKKIASFCSFCMNFLWTQLQISFQNVLIIPPVTPHSTIFGFTDHKVNHNLINQILFMLKYYVYDTRENGSLDLKVLKTQRTYFEIYSGATVGRGKGKVFYSSICYFALN